MKTFFRTKDLTGNKFYVYREPVVDVLLSQYIEVGRALDIVNFTYGLFYLVVDSKSLQRLSNYTIYNMKVNPLTRMPYIVLQKESIAGPTNNVLNLGSAYEAI